MRRREDWIKCAAFAILAVLVAMFVMMLVKFVGGRAVAMMLGTGCVAGVCYWWWCKRSEGRAKKKEAPSAEYNHDLTRAERKDLSREMRELEEQLKKSTKKKLP